MLTYPLAAYAADYGSNSTKAPPVAQNLVREGDFAVKLAVKLGLGVVTDEAVAEDMLVKAGVVPLNGWISDYPVTPEIVGQLQDSIDKASASGTLRLTRAEASRAIVELTAELNLPSPAGPETAAAPAERVPDEYSNPTVINNYYSDQGPPVMTYYAPPYDYAYLYDWVPYPLWWDAFWFPGFYICRHFTTVAVVSSGGTVVVSNQVIDPVSNTVAVVSPVTQTSSGSVRAVTALKTEGGKTFTNVTEMRAASGFRSAEAARPIIPASASLNRETLRSAGGGRSAASEAVAPVRSGGFRSNESRQGAGSILNRSVERMNTAPANDGFATRGAASSGGTVRSLSEGRVRDGGFSSGNTSERSLSTPSVAPARSFSAPSMGGGTERQFAAPSAPSRSYSAPERASIAPSAPARSYSAPERSFSGGGERGGGSGGRGCSGGRC